MATDHDPSPPKATISWQEIAAAKRQEIADSIPSEWRLTPELRKHFTASDRLVDMPHQSNFFTAQELEYTDASTTQLVANLQSGRWKSAEVTRAFCKRAAVAHQWLNCLSEAMFDTAIADAEALDAHFLRHGPMGPLHGLPVSLKDNLHVRGRDSTIGFVSLVGKPAAADSPLVTMLRRAGAVVYVKTQTPMAMMIAETVNNIVGVVHNPLRRGLTAGGSSGGEAALIAFGGSPLGVGSDIGGSLRIPAACCGLFTIRPSFGRFPTIDTQSGLAGQEAIQSVNGALAARLEALELYCKASIAGEPWLYDPRCVELPWRDVEEPSKLRIGVMKHDGVVMPTPPVIRALQHTVDCLKRCGHEIVNWQPVSHLDAMKLVGRIFLADGGKSVEKLLSGSGEPIRPEMQDYATSTEIGVYEMWQIHRERTELSKRYLERWRAAGIDVLLCPTTPHVSCPHGSPWYVGYTAVFNLIDYTAVSFPTGLKFDPQVDESFSGEIPMLSELDATMRSTYKPEMLADMPISLQLVGGRLQEEKLLAMTKVVLEALEA